MESDAESEEAVTTAQRQELEAGARIAHDWGYWTFAFGIGAAIVMYCRGLALAHALLKVAPLRWLWLWLRRGMYLDEIFGGLFVGVWSRLARMAAAMESGGGGER